MQRLLSLATLGVLGGLAWMFLSGGGLSGVAGPQGTTAQSGVGGFALPSGWPSPTASPTGANPPPIFAPTTSSSPVGAATPPIAGGPTIRIASYNIQVFGKAKADKPEVMKVLDAIVRQFDVVAIQEIRDADDYLIPNFVRQINSAGRRYDFVIGERLGNTQSKEQYAYIFDTDRVEIDRMSVYTLGDPDNLLHREPLVATFRTRGVDPSVAFTFTLVNVHTDPDVAPDEVDALAEAYRAIRRSGQEDDVIMLGDFNLDDRRLGRLGQIPGIVPVIRDVFTNTRQTKLYDNIIFHQPSTTEYEGKSGVFDVMRTFNLTLDWADQVSDHFPVWAEFSVYERDYQGRIASRAVIAR